MTAAAGSVGAVPGCGAAPPARTRLRPGAASVLATAAFLATACAGPPRPAASPVAPAPGPAAAATPAAIDPQDAFWASVAGLCGQAFEGQVAESVPPDTGFAGRRLVMHVRECADDEIRIPFHVGEDRSRTWVLTRTGQGLRLKHDHRHRDGTPDEITQYGGDTADPGTATRQSFPADAETAALLPAAATNVWTVDVEPGRRFVYSLRREGTERRFSAAFDLTQPVDPPPPPWGAEPVRGDGPAGPADGAGPADALRDAEGAEAFAALEAGLLERPPARTEFRITSEGAFEASIEGALAFGPGGAPALTARGTFDAEPVDLSLAVAENRLRGGNGERTFDEPLPAETPKALLIGMTRMGLLHNLARLVSGRPPDRAAGGVEEWVRVQDVTWAGDVGDERALAFDIEVGGQPAGEAVLRLDARGLPALREQVVRFPGGEMRVVERYEIP